MLARMQQWVSVFWIGGTLAWLAAFASAGRPWTALVGALVIAGAHAWVLAVEFMVLPWINRDDPAPKASARVLLRAWWAEVRVATRVFGWRQPWRSHAEPDHLPAAAKGRRSVVFVHGFMCNRGFWNPWMARLRARGVPFVAVNLEPVLGSIERYADTIETAVRDATLATGLPPVIVAHSMGGLAVRAWLCGVDADDRVHSVITIGTPHGGTWLAGMGLAHNAREMRLGCEWVERLGQREAQDRRELFTCFYSHCDNIACPASTGTLAGADNRHVEGQAHVQLAFDERVFDALWRRLDPAAASAPASERPAAVEGRPA
jgi:triacylglycerol lipase